jgi:hypothetical protein
MYEIVSHLPPLDLSYFSTDLFPIGFVDKEKPLEIWAL